MKLKKLQQTFKEMKSRERNELQKLDAEATNAYDRKELHAGKSRKQYRSNLGKIIGFVEGLHLKPEHLECLKTTPFYTLYEPFIEKRVTVKALTGTQRGLVKILSMYDHSDKAFHLGGQKLTMTGREVELIYGIKSGKKEIDVCQAAISDSEFGRKKFPGATKVTALSYGRRSKTVLREIPRKILKI